jgi:multimeric flavodoxin WrbA
MKVVAFNGSARKDGNTARLVREVFGRLEAAGIETELVQLAGQSVHGCSACYQCYTNQDQRCAYDDDCINTCIAKMREAQGVILASPVYVADVTPEIKCLMDRAGLVVRANSNMLRGKVGAAVVAVRRAGGIHAFDTLNHFFLISQMVIPGSSYWNIGYGRNIGDVEQDAEGMQTMRDLGENMAWALHKLHG